jgi:type II secretory pathway pseudopilin PulG
VELLVVVTIIGILVSLLLPAVQAAREAARRLQCSNNIKQLALGMHQHLQAQGFFPSGGWGYTWAPHPARGFGANQPGGWGYQILPYIEAGDLHDIGSTCSPTDASSQALQNSNVQRLTVAQPIWYCPTRRRALLYPVGSNISFCLLPVLSGQVTQTGRCDYAANGGEIFYGFGPGPSQSQAQAALVDPTSYPNWPNALVNSTGITAARSEFSDSMVTDGLSNTYMVGEKGIEPNYYLTGQSLGDDQGPLLSDERDAVRWAQVNGKYLAPQIDYLDNTDYISFAFGSAHIGIFNMAMCDGQVRSISYSISELTHRHLCNRCDGQTVDWSHP